MNITIAIHIDDAVANTFWIDCDFHRDPWSPGRSLWWLRRAWLLRRDRHGGRRTTLHCDRERPDVTTCVRAWLDQRGGDPVVREVIGWHLGKEMSLMSLLQERRYSMEFW